MLFLTIYSKIKAFDKKYKRKSVDAGVLLRMEEVYFI